MQIISKQLSPELKSKYAVLCQTLRNMGQVVVGFSGGVDSTLVLKVARDVLGDSVVAVIGDSEAFPQGEVDAALALARSLGVEVVCVRTHELANPHFAVNTPDRCYHCKNELFGMLRQVANERGIAWVVDGSHAEDGRAGDHRPGLRAAAEQGVRSPLREAGLTKSEIRALARCLGLPNWDKPSFACLSSRFPYGTRITPELLARLDRCEQVLRDLGFRQCRVRHHDTVARIEVEPGDLEQVLQHRQTILKHFREAGYAYVALDLEGYRSGKMNDTLKERDAPVIPSDQIGAR
ncbi:MAG: ATP-dependent sacrificial sulfur transferase LarE [Chloroherpetonaceae bacterium]|nr:ATP-dependent sacrificial sulfur transferase LarE [Chthonomonadaceae bacterium]MDW8209033.1 ATP-dependent sacrificial sulfur transferase LarE [Chloroherpetonaceae bacterium]